MSNKRLLSCFGLANVEDPNGDAMVTSTQIESRNQGTKTSACCLWVVGSIAVILLLFPVVTIPILFTLYSKLGNGSQAYQTASSGAFAIAVQSSNAPLTVGTPVSLSNTGSIQIGGGTTIYRNLGAIPTDPCPKYLSSTPIFEDKFLVSYADGATGIGYMSVMQVNSTKQTSVLARNENIYDLYHVVTLNQGTGLFVSITQAANAPVTGANIPNTANIIAGRSNKNNGYAIQFGAPVRYNGGNNNSIDPSICVLSNTSFAIGYYGYNPKAFFLGLYPYSNVYTRWGTVNPVTLVVTLSTPMMLADDTNGGVYFTLTGLSAYQYIFLYYNSTIQASSDNSLHAIVMNATTSNGVLAVQKVGIVQTLVGSNLGANSIKASTLDSGDIVVAYGDVLTNNGISCTVIKVHPYDGTIWFGPKLEIASGHIVQSQVGYGPTGLSIATIGGGQQFMVMFVDLTLDGAIVTAIGEYAYSVLLRVSPNYQLNVGFPSVTAPHTFVSLSVSKRTIHGSHVAILSAEQAAVCATPSTATSDFSWMEILPKPVGVMSSSVTSADVSVGSVALSGPVSGFSGLTPGFTYYTTTSGKVITDGVYYGRDSTTNPANGYFYVTDVAGKVIVSSESLLGVAITSNTILLSK